MKKLAILFFSFCNLVVLAQKPPSQAEINKMMKEMEKNPEIKKAMQQAGAKNFEDLEEGNEWSKLPARKTKLLAALPKTILTNEALQTYLNTINTQVSNGLKPQEKQNIKIISDSAKNNALYLSRAAIGAWYNNQPMQALALAVKAAAVKPDNGEILNTAGALLNLCGFPHKSIPVLQSLLVKAPGSSTVLNNLGQAYLSLGDAQKAEQYLLQCVSVSKNHVEANKSLAMMYRAMGQTSKAQSCISKSLEGGVSETAVDIARELGISEELIDDRVIKSVKDVKAPEYFNPYKYKVPPLCESVAQARECSENHEKFRAFIEAEIKKYEGLMHDEEAKINKNVAGITGSVANGQVVRFVPSPMFE
jgi:Flp pilus assembly protein TadD